MRLEEAVRAVEQQIGMLTTLVQETEVAIAALKSLKEKGEGLLPIGAGVFVPVEMKGEQVLTGIGANVFVEKSVDEAIKILEKRKESVKKVLEETKKRRLKLIEQARRVPK
ncbi:MAG TPA: prefoldin subunit alpha [Euryarchaeota archaeon]|nr:prefoldin subunit alpha [Euryarchaeota archaeon]